MANNPKSMGCIGLVPEIDKIDWNAKDNPVVSARFGHGSFLML